MIHVQDEDFARDCRGQFHEAFLTHTSTSPNYQILASLDLARRQVDLEGYGLVSRAYQVASVLRRRIAVGPAAAPVLPRARAGGRHPRRVPALGIVGYSESDAEHVRGLVSCATPGAATSSCWSRPGPRSTWPPPGMNGDTFKNEVLMDRFGLQVNKTSINSVLFIVTIGATLGGPELPAGGPDDHRPGPADPARSRRSPVQLKVLERRVRRPEHRPAAAARLQPVPRAVPALPGQSRGRHAVGLLHGVRRRRTSTT